jgi:hypothetical protein
MAADPKQPGPNLSGNAVVWVAILAAAVAYVGNRSSLENLRPRVNEPSTTLANVKQDIDARLWQDPFETVLAAEGTYYGWSAAGTAVGPTSHVCDPTGDAHCRTPLTGDDSSAQVIGIIVPGGPYSEDVEFRRRTRYAVLAALHVLEYTPRDAEHIGVYIPTASYSQGAPPDAPGPRFVPYEFLKSHGEDPLGLFWLDEDALGNHPLKQLAQLFCTLHAGSTGGPRIKILGPQGSDTLLAMARNAEDWAAGWKTCAGAPAGLDLYDYSATADPVALCLEVNPDGCPSGSDWVASQLRHVGIGFFRATATDDILARAIRAELLRRDIHPGPDGAHIVLISELDTLYGRLLPETVERCLTSSSTDGPCNGSGKDSNGKTPDWLTRYSYLRGLDGQTANSSAAAQTAGSSTVAATSNGANPGSATGGTSATTSNLLSETAEGEGQGDYLVRLASGMRNEDSRLRNQGEQGIRAVGILGSDLYDKLLVLQAVKSSLPNALFFTTDLDQRLVRPAQGVSTVNLIVASGLGLSLRRSLQQDMPPFRGSYQTAAYLAALMAACEQCIASESAGPNRTKSKDAQIAAGWFTNAETYEIGRTRPILLGLAADPPGNDCADGSSPPDVFGCTTIMPGYRPQSSSVIHALGVLFPEAGTVFALSALLLRFALGRRLSSGFGQPRRVTLRRRKLGVARWVIPGALAGVVLGFQFWGWRIGEHTDMAPLFQGVGPWPSICIQLLSVAFGIAAMFNVHRSSDVNLRRVRKLLCMKRFMVSLEKSRPNERFRLRRALPIGARRWKGTGGAGGDARNPTGEPADRTKQFWVRYVDYGRHRVQLFRVTAFTTLGMVVAGTMYLVLPSPWPPVSLATDIVYIGTALVDAVTTLAVALYVADITLFSRLFVREAFTRDSKPPVWLLSAKEDFAELRLRTALKLEDATQDALVTTTMTITYVSERTKSITPFIYYPFIMIALSLISHSHIMGPSGFAPWSITVDALGLLVAFLSAIALRGAAEDARNETVRNLQLVKWRTLTPECQTQLGNRIDLLIRYVTDLSEGAFSPLSQQPFVRALLLPLASYGSTLLIKFLSIAP